MRTDHGRGCVQTRRWPKIAKRWPHASTSSGQGTPSLGSTARRLARAPATPVVGYRPAGDLASVHCQDSPWHCFLSCWYFVCFRVLLIDEILGCPAVNEGRCRALDVGASSYLPLFFLLGRTDPCWIRYTVFLRRFLFLGRLGSPSGCCRFGIFPRVLVSRRFGPCWLGCIFGFLVVFFIGGFGRSVWPPEWLRLLWLSAVFGKMSPSSAVEASISCWPGSSGGSVPWAPISRSSCESVSAGGVEFHSVGVR